MNDLRKEDWEQAALRSEIMFSLALGGVENQYDNFIHIHNPFVPWAGDFNRTVGARISDYSDFELLVEKVGKIHREKGLNPPDRYDIYPPVLNRESWGEYLRNRGFILTTALFLYAEPQGGTLSEGFSLVTSSESGYCEWFDNQQKDTEYYNDKWFEMILPMKKKFIRIFKHYRLMKDNEIVGWLYAAFIDNYCRLFEVEIDKRFRGRGYGRILLNGIRSEAGKRQAEFILLQTSESLRDFYEKSGFLECTRNSVVFGGN